MQCRGIKFPSFVNFLEEQRSILEHEMANLRIIERRDTSYNTGYVNYGNGYNKSRNGNPKFKYRVFHNSSTHTTSECTTHLNKPVQERFNLIKEVKGCWLCLQVGH